MADEKTNGVILNPVPVTREGATLEFVSGKGKKGAWKDVPILTIPEITKDNIQLVLNWMGDDITFQTISAFLRQKALGWYDQAYEEAFDKQSGTLDQVKLGTVFAKMAEDFSARGDSMKEITEKITDLLNEAAGIDGSTPEGENRLKVIMKEVVQLNIAKNARKRTTREEADEKAEATVATK